MTTNKKTKDAIQCSVAINKNTNQEISHYSIESKAVQINFNMREIYTMESLHFVTKSMKQLGRRDFFLDRRGEAFAALLPF